MYNSTISSATKQTYYRAAGIYSSSPAAHEINFFSIFDRPGNLNELSKRTIILEFEHIID